MASPPKIKKKKPVKAAVIENSRDTREKPSGFHNPYNFIPVLPRKVNHAELGDRHPNGHGAYHSSLWSGRIAVELTIQTPLLIPDAAKVEVDRNDHKTFPVRIDSQGRPSLAPTAVKGMLRSAYEAVTNSRFGVFEKHSDRLAYRMQAKLGPIPARVERTDGDKLALQLMEASVLGSAGKLPRYKKGTNLPLDKGEHQAALKYENSNDLPQHGDHVWVQLRPQGYVKTIRRWADEPNNLDEWQEGWVCITGANVKDKTSERVFLPSPADRFIPVDDDITKLWSELIRNYQEVHAKDLEDRRKKDQKAYHYLGKNPGKTAWSRHVHIPSEARLKAGTLCYVELRGNEVTGMQPVTIARRLFTQAPQQLLHKSLKPAMQMAELSPADRVFGWVKQKGKGAYKGNLRVSPVTCQTAEAIQPFEGRGLSLAILGKPNPQQFRFYLSEDKGKPISNTTRKEQGYSKGQTLRGRKVYPHHQHLAEDDWQTASEGGELRDYMGSDRTNQNRSVTGWVKPDTKFTFNLDITNLSAVELGALLWLLTLPEAHYHRLGGSKPLGFGSVSITLDETKTDLRTGAHWQEFYGSLLSVEHPTFDIDKMVSAFKDAVTEAYADKPAPVSEKALGGFAAAFASVAKPAFERVPFIESFLVMTAGFDDRLPVHYPRTTVDPNLKGEGFDWFVDNERTGGKKLSLPLLVEDEGLPFSPI